MSSARKERIMEPGYRYRWTHMREYMHLTPPYDVDQPDDESLAAGDRLVDTFVGWLSWMGIGGLLLYAVTILSA
jgi:hypothetical protein